MSWLQNQNEKLLEYQFYFIQIHKWIYLLSLIHTNDKFWLDYNFKSSLENNQKLKFIIRFWVNLLIFEFEKILKIYTKEENWKIMKILQWLNVIHLIASLLSLAQYEVNINHFRKKKIRFWFSVLWIMTCMVLSLAKNGNCFIIFRLLTFVVNFCYKWLKHKFGF